MSDSSEVYDVPALKAALQEKMGARVDCYPSQLEQRFPRILAKITELWGTAQMEAYLDSLMVSDRPSRQGLPPDVAMEVFRLSSAHAALGLIKETEATGWNKVETAAWSKKGFVKDIDPTE